MPVTIAEVQKLFDRAARVRDTLDQKAGPGAAWQVQVPDVPPHTVSIGAVKQPEIIEDDVAQLLIWCWSLKDYLKELAVAAGSQGKLVESFVDEHPELQLIADLANREKHGRIERSRSGFFPFMRRPSYHVDGKNVAQLGLVQDGVHIDPVDPEAVKVTIPILSEGGEVLGEALALLHAAFGLWEELFAGLQEVASQ